MNPHPAAMIEACWHLGGRSEREYLRLRPLAHMLEFSGHFSTKSRRLSTPLGCLRRSRQEWRTAQTLAGHDLDPDTPVRRSVASDLDELSHVDADEDTVLVIDSWTYSGRGHSVGVGEAIFARTIADDVAESRRIRRQVTYNERLEGA